MVRYEKNGLSPNRSQNPRPNAILGIIAGRGLLDFFLAGFPADAPY
jgi:hypothetical protein